MIFIFLLTGISANDIQNDIIPHTPSLRSAKSKLGDRIQSETSVQEIVAFDDLNHTQYDFGPVQSNQTTSKVMLVYIILFYIVVGVAFIVSIVRCFCVYREEQAQDITPVILIRFVIVLFETYGNLLMFLNAVYSIIWFIAYTGYRSTTDVVQANPSIFRHLALCEKWGQLQARRQTSSTLSMLVVCLVLTLSTGLQFEQGSLSGSLLRTAPRFGFEVLIWVGTSVVQYLFMNVFYYRFVRNPWIDFVEDCCLSNTSLILLPRRQHGYYIHGKGVHPYSEVGMLEVLQNVQAEKDKTTALRGLIPNDNTITFEVYLQRGVRQEYDTSYLQATEALSSNISTRVGGNNHRLDEAIVQSATSYDSLNKFFRSWIERLQSTQEIEVRSTTMMDRLISFPPNLNESHASIFFRDSDEDHFRSVTIGGVEWSFIFIELFIFMCCDFLTQNRSVCSFIATWVLSKAILFLRGYMGKVNIKKKTMTDHRLF
ncbi:putative meckelin [Blattamonas nauphoetae]|uniref:Meckelin n=1 Tax=Blattamonas nauphoetae TaxID=2049346 RepID=A0ABQ9Y4P0_9EUKA|nr:putative meckelin [Blattamonas nauphoetae]